MPTEPQQHLQAKGPSVNTEVCVLPKKAAVTSPRRAKRLEAFTSPMVIERLCRFLFASKELPKTEPADLLKEAFVWNHCHAI